MKNINFIYGILSNGSEGAKYSYRFTNADRALLKIPSSRAQVQAIIPASWPVDARCAAAECIVRMLKASKHWDTIAAFDNLNTYEYPVDILPPGDETVVNNQYPEINKDCLFSVADGMAVVPIIKFKDEYSSGCLLDKLIAVVLEVVWNECSTSAH